MWLTKSIALLSVLSLGVQALPGRIDEQEIIREPDGYDRPKMGVGHFSEWSRMQKRLFWEDWQADKTNEWILVMGNEGGDTDSLTSALTWAYHLTHSTQNTSDPLKAVALLQTPADALDLRPENVLAIKMAKMSAEHKDLLNINELPEDVETLAPKLRGIVLVDHPAPMRRWKDARILSIMDHHVDEGAAPDAKPRIFEKTASCTTIVARQMLDELEKLPEEYHMPHELLQLILSAIALDSKGLNTKKKATKADIETSRRIHARSRWNDRSLTKVMDNLEDKLSDAEKDLDALDLRDLLRRDWKASFIDTPSERTPTVHLGFTSIPISFDAQINRTEYQALFNWFAIHAAFTAQNSIDISVNLNKYKYRDENGKNHKVRGIVLVVRDDIRVDDKQADELFKVAKDAIEGDEKLNVKPWHDADKLGRRQMAWISECGTCSRKYVKPLVEEAVTKWS